MKLFKKLFSFLFITLVWFIFSSPFFLQNKVPFPSTYLVNFFSPWTQYPGFSSPVKNNAMPDVISQIYPWKTFTIEVFRNLQIPFWNPYSFSGTPHLANYQSAILSPFNLLFFALPFIDAWSLLVLFQPLLAGIFMMLYLKSLKLSDISSLLASVAFMFCGFITTWMAYATLGYAILFLPLAFFSVEKFYQNLKHRYLVLFSLTFPLSFFSGHFQISIYFFATVFAYLVFKFYQTKNKKNTFYLLLYFLFGALLSLPQILPSIELYLQSLRSALFQKTEAIPWGYVSTFFAPDFLGNPVTRNDWFGHYAEWNAYIGVMPLFFALYAVLKNKSKTVLFFLTTALITILFSFQTPLLDLLVLLKVPVLSTSAASRLIVVFSFSAAVLSAFGLDKLNSDLKEKKLKRILFNFSSFYLVFIILWSIVLFKLFIPEDKILIARQNLILPTAILVVSSFIIFALIFLKNKKYIPFALFIIVLINSLDLLRFSTKWIPFDPKNLVYPDIVVSKEFKNISRYERVWGNFGSEASMYYRLPSTSGYDAVYIKRYGEFIASLHSGKLEESARSVVNFPVNGKYSSKAIDLLGVKYIINKKSDGQSPWNFPYWKYPAGTFPTIYSDNYYQIFENKNSFPRAFLAKKYVVENDPQKILDIMFSPNFDLRNEVVIEQKIQNVDNTSSGSAKILSYTPNVAKIEVNSAGNSLLFLSDSYYQDWKATIDGKPTKIYRADFAFRAVFIQKGKHSVVFYYDPQSFNLGLLGAIVALFSMTLVGVKTRSTKT